MQRRLIVVIAVSAAAVLAAALAVAVGLPGTAATAPVRVIARYPHDAGAFTQGLVIIDGELWEGTGRYGSSTLRRVDLASGQVLEQVRLAPSQFGEGITGWGDEVIQLTWKEGVGLRYDRRTLAATGEFPLAGEGWGITHDGRHWIVSDGSDALRFLDPVDGRELRRVRVSDGPRPVTELNELEYVQGEVWANLWQRDLIARIDPADGRVLGYLDLAPLWPAAERTRSDAVANGIAYDANTGRLLVTGKHWPWLFEIAASALPDAAPTAASTSALGAAR